MSCILTVVMDCNEMAIQSTNEVGQNKHSFKRQVGTK